jgi:hypothetical protein
LSYEDYVAVFVVLVVLTLGFFLLRRRRGKYWVIEHFDSKPPEYEDEPPKPSLKQDKELVFEGSSLRSYEEFVELLTEEELRRIEERSRPPQD